MVKSSERDCVTSRKEMKGCFFLLLTKGTEWLGRQPSTTYSRVALCLLHNLVPFLLTLF